MSTYWGYVCKSHDPELPSDRWFNHGEELLIGVYLQERYLGGWPNTKWDDPIPVMGSPNYPQGTDAPVWWLREHPRCKVALRSEYGKEVELK